ncbi:glycosyltransferase family 2 protein [Polynucleobacter asymbioticus]|jgi:glycosyltransferase involved in cell wall biosynthesis|uniref:Glycosyltransferase 2-like domain-containing protein n=1 Tax=Polynucleobacter asymbioticus TaxID=576611 RepID=A0AAC9ITV2_9BURK|nr:glycosyltransferase family 2 protein [Polynucleobacter asymbioticus]APB98152.1 hypothetical protein A4F89_01785 [Polynucleobacter asymbioticus]APC00438.1 hypothetical protein AOC25_01790 [Polynucleobacter asymbioticus]
MTGQSFHSCAARKMSPHVAILMCTYNGQAFLDAQLQSIAHQTHSNWSLWISDDGSSDQTIALIKAFSQQIGEHRVHLLDGPKMGFAQNFISLLGRAQIEADFVAFADQDDLWLNNKLAQALYHLESYDAQATLYVGPTIYIDEQNQYLGDSIIFTKQPSFANALVQSIGGGNTMVLNHKALALVRSHLPTTLVISHDWWLYQITTALGAAVIYDPVATVQYRQHQDNLMGMNTSLAQKWRRIKMLWAGNYSKWNEANIQVLRPLRVTMRPGNEAVFDLFVFARKQGVIGRIVGMLKAGVYRQTLLGNLGLWFAIVTKRI